MKTIVFSHAAAKEFDKLPSAIASQIMMELSEYAIDKWAGTHDIKRLKGEPVLRLRIGDWRVIFDEATDRLRIVAILNRREAYR